jgi:hypothetical protein
MRNGKRFIVTTTINAPTEAIARFDEMRDWTLIVVGDRGTPADYHLENGIYLSPDAQERLAPELSRLIGWNCIQRRNLGFVLALDEDADVVATVDDDNIPYPSWGEDLLVGWTLEIETCEAPNGCFDPVGATEHENLWHRGYPLQLLASRDHTQRATRTVRVDVQLLARANGGGLRRLSPAGVCMISIVMVGRNDDYGGDFSSRLLRTTRYNLCQLERRRIEHELVFVEWNPRTDRPLLSRTVVEAFGCARCLVVDGAVHRLVSGNRHIQLFEYHAKNAGVRRARGEWIPLTNPDNFLGAETLAFLEAGQFDPEEPCRAGWIEVAGEGEVDAPDRSDRYADDPSPYLCASGDFFFCARILFDRIGAYREVLPLTNTHKDSILCLAARDLTGRTRKVGNTYHLRHPRDDQSRRRIKYDFSRVDRSPQATYGLEECVEVASAPRITTLLLPESLAGRARRRRPPEPRVPRRYRVRESRSVALAMRLAWRRIGSRAGWFRFG